MIATNSTSDGLVLISLGGGILLLAVIGFVLFTWTRRKKRPQQCEEQREALALAEKAVQYWEAARAHLEAAERRHSTVEASTMDPSHASQVAKAIEGLNAAKQQRDQCQMDLINCMASGVPTLRSSSTAPSQTPPFLVPGTNDSPPA